MNPRKKVILLWGGRSHARIFSSMIEEQSLGQVKVIFDETLKEPYFNSSEEFINKVTDLKKEIPNLTHYIVCIGAEHGYARYLTSTFLDKANLKPIKVIHKSSFVDPTSEIGKGVQIMPSALVQKFTKIGDFSILNSNSTIDHESTIGKGVHVMGSVAISGKVVVKDFSTIGTNATILPSIEVGEGSLVGAGAVVTKNVKPYSVVTGVPAKRIKSFDIKMSPTHLKTLKKL